MQLLPRIIFNDTVSLSIQASAFHYCSPRADLDNINDYDSVEIALFDGPAFVRPSQVGIDGFDDLWAGDDVAGWVPVDRVIALVKALGTKHGIDGAHTPVLGA